MRQILAMAPAMNGALAWLGDQPALAPRADHLFSVIAGALLTPPSTP